MVEGYCVKCRKKVNMKKSKQIKLKNNRPAVKGICPVCGTTVYRMGGMTEEKKGLKTKLGVLKLFF